MLLETEMSSLERMLDSIRLRDERPVGAPPALPSRPTSRGRLPSSRRQFKMKAWSIAPEVDAGCEEKKDVMNSKDSEILGLHSLDNSPDLEVGVVGAKDQVLREIAAPECTRNHSLQGILWVQKHFRARQARSSYQELKRGVTTLQSVVRGERARYGFEYMSKRWKAAVLIQKHVKRWIARKRFDDQRKDVMVLQSGIRGWLTRRHLMVLENSELAKPSGVETNKDLLKKNYQELKASQAELERRVLQAEAALRHKEEENVILRGQLQRYETRWSEYEARMKSLEQTWQQKLTSLQESLVAAKKSLIADDVARQPGRLDASPDHLYFDSEDAISSETRTPEGTPAKQPRPCSSDGARNRVSYLADEFEQQSRAFKETAGFLIEAKSGKSSSNEELRKLETQFDTWKKDYKVRLKETKAALKKLGDDDSKPKARKRWWTPSCTR